jgi:hypothetical protein
LPVRAFISIERIICRHARLPVGHSPLARESPAGTRENGMYIFLLICFPYTGNNRFAFVAQNYAAQSIVFQFFFIKKKERRKTDGSIDNSCIENP